MSLLDVLGGLATATGMGLQGYAQDQKDNLARAIQAAQLQRQAQNDAIENFVKMRGASKLQLGDGPAYAQAMGEVARAQAEGREPSAVQQALDIAKGTAPIDVQKAVDTAQGVSPITVQTAINTAKGTAPIQRATHAAEHDYDVAHPAPVIIPTAGGVVRVGADNVATPLTDANGQPVIKAGAGGAASGNTLLAQGRIGMSYNDLSQAVKQMEDYENSPQNLQAFTPEKRTLGVLAQSQPNAEAHGISGMLGNILTSEASGHAQSSLAKNDQAYQNYVNNAQRVGAALTELLPRPNQQMLGIEKGLSAIDVGGNPGNIANVQARRRGALQMLQGIMEHGGIPGASAPAGAASKSPSDDPEFDALLNKYRRP